MIYVSFVTNLVILYNHECLPGLVGLALARVAKKIFITGRLLGLLESDSVELFVLEFYLLSSCMFHINPVGII